MRVLLATDGSPGSRRALERTAEIARAARAEVWVLVVSSMVFMRPFYGLEQDLLIPTNEEAAEILQEAHAYLKERRVEAHTLHRSGQAADTILAVAAEVEADLVVLGSHGRNGLQRFLLGSVSERVLAQAPCSVLLAREAAHARIEFPDCALVQRA